MIRRILWTSLWLGLCLEIPAAGRQQPATPPAKSQAEGQQKEDPFARFHWLTDSSDTRGLIFDNRKLAILKVDSRDQSSENVETETTRTGTNSLRTTRRVFGRGTNGERQLVEVVVEDLRTAAGDGLSATRTISRRDINGRMMVTRKEVQETVPAGPNTFRTQATALVSRGENSLVRSDEVLLVERKRGEGVLEIERTQKLPGANGTWPTVDQRRSSIRETSGQILAQEEIFRQDANGKLSLSQRDVNREWRDRQGKEYLDSDTYRADAAGNLQLGARSNIVRVAYSDGSMQTTQTSLQVSPVTPSEGLKLVQKIVETSRPADSRTTARDTEVQNPDANGKLQTVFYRRILEKK